MRVKQINKKDRKWAGLSAFPNFHKTGSIAGMKRMYYGKNALLVRSGSWIYNVTFQPDIYNQMAH